MAYILAGRQLEVHTFLYKLFYLVLQPVGQLEALAVKPFYSVIFHCIVRCADHYRSVRFVCSGQVRHCRGGYHSHVYHIAAYGTNARRKRRGEHVAGKARIPAKQYAWLMDFVGEHVCARLAYLQRQLAAKILVCHTAHAVCSKHSRHTSYFLSACFIMYSMADVAAIAPSAAAVTT